MARRKSRRPVNRKSRGRNWQHEGKQAFNNGRYTDAISAWKQAQQQKNSPRIPPALAEAYFRRGVKEKRIDDLETAVATQPDNPIYRYYLGLAYHRNGEFATALDHYRQSAQAGDEWPKRTAYVLVLAQLQQGNDPTQQAEWLYLNEAEQKQCQQVWQLQGKKPPTELPKGAPLWQGIVDYANGRYPSAKQQLTQTRNESAVIQDKSLAHYYLGCIAAHEEEWLTAVTHWEQAQNNGYTSPTLSANLGEAAHRLAEEFTQQQNYQKALKYGLFAKKQIGEDNQLNELIAHAHQQLGYQSANKGEWDQAMPHWEEAERHHKGNFRLSCNLALADEQLGDFATAAERWREALRRRPRKATHPDAISDQEVSQMWLRTAVAYQKSQFYDEANNVMRQAVKWQPDNLDLRLTLVDGFIHNGQFLAAENELQRILDRDENNVPALIGMGEVLSHADQWWRANAAVRYWEKALKLEPNNETIRELLADYYLNAGDYYTDSWYGDHEQALIFYEQGLTYQPNHLELHIALARCYYRLDADEQAITTMEKAQTFPLVNPETCLKLVNTWHIMAMPERATAVIPLIEKNFALQKISLYLMVATDCLINNRSDWAQTWIDSAQQQREDEPIYLVLGEMLLMSQAHPNLVEKYLQMAIDTQQEPGHAYLLMGVAHALRGDLESARPHWKKAKKIAKKEKDQELLTRIDEAEAMFNNPFGFMSHLLNNLDFDEDFDDDDFFF